MDAYIYNVVHDLLEELKNVFDATVNQQLEKLRCWLTVAGWPNIPG